jgi:hypothetical protein
MREIQYFRIIIINLDLTDFKPVKLAGYLQ